MKIVTTIGTSLVTNVINPLKNRSDLTKEEAKAVENFSKLRQKGFIQKKSLQKEYKNFKEFVLSRIEFDEKTSAEIKSIVSISKNHKFKDVYFEIEPIATDTLLSPLCSEILKYLIEKNIKNTKVSEPYIIADLQVSDYKRYKKGLINLLNTLNKFAYNGDYFGNMILNITGGFKGVIPYMTIYGQINKIPLFYIFEFTNALIEIPQIPISIDENIFEKDWQKFYKLDQKEILDKNEFDNNFAEDYENILDVEENFISFNALGKILWDKYKRDNFVFYATDEVYSEIKKQPNILNILKTKFQFNHENKTELKNEHYVYDDGNNPYRIFYFKKGDNFYIYKTFENHDKYEKFIQIDFDSDKFIKNSTIQKI